MREGRTERYLLFGCLSATCIRLAKATKRAERSRGKLVAMYLYSCVVDFKDLSIEDQKRGLQGETFGLTETAPVSKEYI